MSNIISETPTVDTTESLISKPTWVVSINGSPNSDVVLRSVILSYGTSFSSAIFEINQDPDTGSFPSYNDDIDVVVNGRNIFKGKIKGITSILTRRGLGKTFTALSNITTLTEKVVDPDNKDFNDKNTTEEDRLNVSQIVTQILGSTPAGTPTDDPGELHLTDMTLLDAVQTTVNKVGNYKLFWNKDTNLLEIYRFGQGGDVTRQFVKGVNIISKTITENRQGVVDKLTLIGPPRAVRVRKIVDATLEPDENGVHRLSFTITGKNIRDINVEGQYRDQPTFTFNGLQVLPEDMDFPINISGPLRGFAEWPFFPLGIYGNVKGDVGFRTALSGIFAQPTIFSTIGSSAEFDNKKGIYRIFLSDVPKTYFHIVKDALVDKTKIGVSDGFESSQTVSVRVRIFVGWVRGQIRVTYTEDRDAPTLTVGSGIVERTITDAQYQIIKNNIDIDPTIDNESEVLALMQKRLDAEFETLNRPPLGGTIVVPGDETLDLKSTVLVSESSIKLDVVNIVHNFTRGFTSSVSLTNEPFLAVFVSTTPTAQRKQQERFVGQQTRFTFEDIEIDQETASQRQIEFQRRLEEAGLSSAIYQD